MGELSIDESVDELVEEVAIKSARSLMEDPENELQEDE